MGPNVHGEGRAALGASLSTVELEPPSLLQLGLIRLSPIRVTNSMNPPKNADRAARIMDESSANRHFSTEWLWFDKAWNKASRNCPGSFKLAAAVTSFSVGP